MRLFRSNSIRFVLAIALGSTLGLQPLRAATNDVSPLKFGEVRDFARLSYYSAFSLFVLTGATVEQKTLVIKRLSEDGSSKALEALAEIAAAAEDPALAQQAFDALLKARPYSVKALKIVATLSYDDARRAQAQVAGEGLPAHVKNPRVPTPIEKQLEGFDIKFAKDLLEKQGEDLRKDIRLPEDLSNGSRYVVQSWFLKKVLSLQNASDEARLIRLDFLLNEVSMYLAKEPVTVKIDSPKALEAFKESLKSRYAYLQDEMNFSKGLSDQKPVRLEISDEMKPAVQALSDGYRLADQKLTMLNDIHFFDILSNNEMAGFLFRLRLKAQSDQEKLQEMKLISNEFQKQYLGLQTVAPKLIESRAIQFANPAEQRFFELMISHYFSVYTFEETANVMKAILERPDKQSGTDLFHLMVMYAGPQMQKLLQVVGRRPGISPELSMTFRRLEESGLPSPWERVGPNFKDAPMGFEWVSLDHHPRVGSMAETYQGVVKDHSGHEYVIAARTLKSDIRERVEREIPRLIELGRVIDNDPILRHYDFPLVGPVMDDVMAMARSELDVASTIEAQRTGERIYTHTSTLEGGVIVHFKTPKTLVATNPDVIDSTWLKGEKFEDFAKREPDLAVRVAEATAHHWIENALFKELFFHADLHQGNLKVWKNGPKEFTVNLLDFGMVGRLKKNERSTIIKLSLAASSNTDASLIAKYLYALSEPGKSTISLLDLQKSARAYLIANRGPTLTMDIWIGWALSKGVKLPKNITAFSRGIGAVEQLTIASGSHRWLADMVKEVALQHKMELAPDLLAYLRDAASSSMSRAARKVRGDDKNLAIPTRTLRLTCESLFAN